MYLVENSHPAIISRDIFHRTQEELARRKALRPKSDKTSITQSGKYSKYALSEVLHCAECGSRYKRVTWNIRGKKKIVWITERNTARIPSQWRKPPCMGPLSGR